MAKMDRSEWFHMTPRGDFIELMFQCEDKDWDWATFEKAVQEHFTKLHPELNKGKTVKKDSLVQKCRDINKRILAESKSAEFPDGDKSLQIRIPTPTGTEKVNWGDILKRRRERK